MIDVIDVTKRFGRFTALSGLSLSVHKASIYGLVGFNGAGKTTLLKTIAGIYRPEEGVVREAASFLYAGRALFSGLRYAEENGSFL